MTLLYAVGTGASVGVVLAVLARLLRIANVGFDAGGEAVIAAVATTMLVASRGATARADVVRVALIAVASSVAIVINRVLGVAFTGRAPGDLVSTDAFLFVPRMLAALAVALLVGVAIGAILRAYSPPVRWRPPDRPTRAIGIAYVSSVVATVLWPAPFLGQLLGDNVLATAIVSLPLVLAGPLIGGAYAARAGLGYRTILLIALFLGSPFIITLLAGTVADLGRLGDRRFDAVAGQLRAGIALSWFLVTLRVAGWPLGAAFAQGFLTPEARASSETTP
ncbi:MAG TPA: hypothetical protein VGQ86_03480 [Candidatus Limnocylindria bacterium]|nr:hypothetical protein [Candidatus Limnocylindria bacterium]